MSSMHLEILRKFANYNLYSPVVVKISSNEQNIMKTRKNDIKLYKYKIHRRFKVSTANQLSTLYVANFCLFHINCIVIVIYLDHVAKELFIILTISW